MNIKLFPIARSLASYFLPSKIFKRPGSGGTFSSEYCYSVWLRHLVTLVNGGLLKNVKELNNIAEIGPGDSFGIGLAALYTGASNYFAFDVIKHSDLNRNILINKDLLNYFKKCFDIPNGNNFKEVHPVLNDYSFPGNILTYEPDFYEQRYVAIENVLKDEKYSNIKIKYIVPWPEEENEDISNIDLIFSQAVMEHVYDIKFAYNKMYKWLKKGGIISHQIDFKGHEITREWNGHWFINETVWKFLMKGRKYPINRHPLSAHIKSIEDAGFKIKTIIPDHRANTFINKAPKVINVNFTDEDMITSGALIQAIKI